MSDSIIIFASSRRNGNTGKFSDFISEQLNIDIIDLADKNISPFDYEHKNINDDFISTMDEVLAHKNIIFSTPVYWYSMSAQMKIFIDRMSDFLSVNEFKDKGRKLRGKAAYVICTSISPVADQSFVNSFKSTFEYLGMSYGGHIHANCSNGYIADHYATDVNDFVKSVNESTYFCL